MVAPAASESAKPPVDLHILLVEDNAVNQEVAGETLSFLGYSYDLAATGGEALNLFGKGRYDLILMDCHLPDIDGFDATKAIRCAEAANGATRTPIIALTADALTEDRARCLACGMDDHLGKPFKRPLFAAMLEKWVTPSSGAAEGASRSISNEELSNASVVAARTLDSGALDQIRSLQRPGQPSILAKVVGAFDQSVPELLTALDESIARGDADAVRKQAHTIKSASANLGAMELSQNCRELEHRASQGTLDGIASLLSRIRDDYGAASSSLRECLAADAVTLGAVGHG
jgi:CheY-like chemotaxis protein/HPt (histidine-containing phosphotransfer) domain-containing protein